MTKMLLLSTPVRRLSLQRSTPKVQEQDEEDVDLTTPSSIHLSEEEEDDEAYLLGYVANQQVGAALRVNRRKSFREMTMERRRRRSSTQQQPFLLSMSEREEPPNNKLGAEINRNNNTTGGKQRTKRRHSFQLNVLRPPTRRGSATANTNTSATPYDPKKGTGTARSNSQDSYLMDRRKQFSAMKVNLSRSRKQPSPPRGSVSSPRKPTRRMSLTAHPHQQRSASGRSQRRHDKDGMEESSDEEEKHRDMLDTDLYLSSRDLRFVVGNDKSGNNKEKRTVDNKKDTSANLTRPSNRLASMRYEPGFSKGPKPSRRSSTSDLSAIANGVAAVAKAAPRAQRRLSWSSFMGGGRSSRSGNALTPNIERKDTHTNSNDMDDRETRTRQHQVMREPHRAIVRKDKLMLSTSYHRSGLPSDAAAKEVAKLDEDMNALESPTKSPVKLRQMDVKSLRSRLERANSGRFEFLPSSMPRCAPLVEHEADSTDATNSKSKNRQEGRPAPPRRLTSGALRGMALGDKALRNEDDIDFHSWGSQNHSNDDDENEYQPRTSIYACRSSGSLSLVDEP